MCSSLQLLKYDINLILLLTLKWLEVMLYLECKSEHFYLEMVS
jgi:hypothetical protein